MRKEIANFATGSSGATDTQTMGVRGRQAERANVGAIDGFRCYACKTPTAATIDHVAPRVGGGHSWIDNLKLACPYCNSRKCDLPVEQFLSEKLYLLPARALPPTLTAMLDQEFDWRPVGQEQEVVESGVRHAHLVMRGSMAAFCVRVSKDHPWQAVAVLPADDPLTIRAAFEFLWRHNLRPAKR